MRTEDTYACMFKRHSIMVCVQDSNYNWKLTSIVAPSKHTPFSMLDTPAKRMHLRHQYQWAKALAMQVQQQKARLEKVQQQSVVMGEARKEMEKLPKSSFKRMFWEQQV